MMAITLCAHNTAKRVAMRGLRLAVLEQAVATTADVGLHRPIAGTDRWRSWTRLE